MLIRTLLIAILLLGCAGSEHPNAVAAREFLDTNRGKSGIVETASGLQYEVLREGEGCRPQPSSEVSVHYEWRVLGSDRVLDSSYERGEPGRYPLDKLMPSWAEAVPLMRTGAKWRLYVPPDLGYGARGSRGTPRIEPYSLLIFDVELLEAYACSRDAV